jgi:SNF2 family DNA or RNA helicase
MKWTPHAYQKQAIKFMVERGAAGLFLDPGLGKSSVTLATFKLLKKQGLVRRMLVIAPLRPAYSVWPGEAQKWDEFRELKVSVLHGPDKEDRLKAGADVFVINPEGLTWLATHKQEEVGCDMLAVDESTRFKHGDTQRFKTLRPMLAWFRRRYILTGSPAPNGLLDLFGQCYILDQGNALGRYITHYRMNYFNPSGFGGYTWLPKAGAQEAIYKKLQPLVLRMSGADYLDLPPYISNTVEVELPEEQRATYDQMEKLLLATVEDGVITAANAAAATSKCRQIANGGIYHDGGEKWTNLHHAKSDAVVEIVEELSGKPCLVAYEFRHDLDRLLRVFPDAPHIGGGVSPRRFREIEGAWNAGEIPVLLAQPQSVAHGLNLQGVGAAVVLLSVPWDLETYEQFIRRVWRQGQKERVGVHHIIAKNTIDEIVMKVLVKKDRVQQDLLEALKTKASRRAA